MEIKGEEREENTKQKKERKEKIEAESLPLKALKHQIYFHE